jgi:hypothetical protein
MPPSDFDVIHFTRITHPDQQPSVNTQPQPIPQSSTIVNPQPIPQSPNTIFNDEPPTSNNDIHSITQNLINNSTS